MTLWTRISGRVALGIAGLGLGAASFVIAAYSFVELMASPEYLVALYHALHNWRAGTVNDRDVYALAQITGAVFGVFGTALMALLLTYLGVPLRLKKVPADTGGALPPS